MTIILGIDPGSRITGYGLIRNIGGKNEYLDSGCIRTDPQGVLSQKLMQIYNGICELMETYSPTEVAIEQVFMHQNPNSALKLGHARGAAMVACAAFGVSIYEYSAREIKQNIVGFGGAEKAQVSHMVVQLLSLNAHPQRDAADALAIAIGHGHFQSGFVKRRNLGRRK